MPGEHGRGERKQERKRPRRETRERSLTDTYNDDDDGVVVSFSSSTACSYVPEFHMKQTIRA